MGHQIFNNLHHDASFKQNGYVVLDLLSDNDVNQLIQAFAKVEQQHMFDYVASVVLHDFEMRKSIHEHLTPVFDRSILPSLFNYKFIVGSFVAKKPSSSKGKFPLHQDPTFVDEEKNVGMSIWCPLVDVDENNGCLGVLPGSHYLSNHFRNAAMLPYPEWVEILESNYMQYIPMKVGQVLFMNTRMIHGSPPNLSAKMRPVAAGVAIPKGEHLLCCHIDENIDSQKTNVYEVEDNFYLTYIMQSLPNSGKLLKTVPKQVEELSVDKIESLASGILQS
ncbi:MAG: phytanoyl-CoA dioxygenase family protein [Saprospiraceae bacterium]